MALIQRLFARPGLTVFPTELWQISRPHEFLCVLVADHTFWFKRFFASAPSMKNLWKLFFHLAWYLYWYFISKKLLSTFRYFWSEQCLHIMMELDEVFIRSYLLMEDEESGIQWTKCVIVAFLPPFDFDFPIAPCKIP